MPVRLNFSSTCIPAVLKEKIASFLNIPDLIKYRVIDQEHFKAVALPSKEIVNLVKYNVYEQKLHQIKMKLKENQEAIQNFQPSTLKGRLFWKLSISQWRVLKVLSSLFTILFPSLKKELNQLNFRWQCLKRQNLELARQQQTVQNELLPIEGKIRQYANQLRHRPLLSFLFKDGEQEFKQFPAFPALEQLSWTYSPQECQALLATLTAPIMQHISARKGYFLAIRLKVNGELGYLAFHKSFDIWMSFTKIVQLPQDNVRGKPVVTIIPAHQANEFPENQFPIISFLALQELCRTGSAQEDGLEFELA
jgi:hypothetical protein